MSPCKVLGLKTWRSDKQKLHVKVLLKVEGQQREVTWIEGALASVSAHILPRTSAKHKTMQFSSFHAQKHTHTGGSPVSSVHPAPPHRLIRTFLRYSCTECKYQSRSRSSRSSVRDEEIYWAVVHNDADILNRVKLITSDVGCDFDFLRRQHV